MSGLVSPTEAAAVITPVVARGTESLKRQATLFFAMALPLLWLPLCPGISQYWQSVQAL